MSNINEQLIGRQISGDWIIIEPLMRGEGATGGCYSECYKVRHQDGRSAFLKGINFSEALSDEDPARALERLTASFNFERDLLAACGQRKLDRVVRAIDSGKIDTKPLPIQYLLFELADGDSRQFSVFENNFNTAWSLRALHQIAVGLMQLHGSEIAHQDLKPSNVLVFGSTSRKLGDLGRAAWKNQQPPHHDDEVAGDQVYAPPELLYHDVASDWDCRRFGCDAYLLGSMVTYFFIGEPMTAELYMELQPQHRWMEWTGSYKEVLPYIRDAFARVTERFSMSVDKKWRDQLTRIVKELCDPDPSLRGHPRARVMIGNPYDLQRYISEFDTMAFHAEYLDRPKKAS